MEEPINYLGEHLWCGTVGTAMISIALSAAIISSISYLFYFFNPTVKSFKIISRLFFILHCTAVFTIIATMFYMMNNHFFEYEYVQHHTSLDIEKCYLFAAFWEDQSGSFLLWIFWHCIIGLILIFTSKKWESSVMMTLSLVQAFLLIMILGIYLGDIHIGNNPFRLLRENPELANAPFLQNANYLEKIVGRGLNPLLKNYWMTIHPPTLFLGFALSVVPFLFSIGGLLTRKHDQWQHTALPWAFTGVLVLGTGILMGGAWAYEALSFGGFWAWDPVENASFVPWLTLVGAAHLMLINKTTGRSVFSTYIFSVITFILTLYSTFLTRSGILGESSVHAFTELGLETLLVWFLLFFIVLPVSLLLKKRINGINYFLFSALLILIGQVPSINHKSVFYLIWATITLVLIFYEYFKEWLPKETTEENTWSREFWMFIGSLLLFLFALVVSIFTSLPVVNRIFNSKFALEENGMKLYNVLGLLFGIFVLFLISITQYFKYKNTLLKKWNRNFIFSGICSTIILIAIILRFCKITDWEASTSVQKISFFISPFFLLVAVFAVFCNAEYWIRILKGKIKNAGSSIAHIGFALVMIGCVVSNQGKRVFSKNTSQKDISLLGEKFNNKTNIYLEKGDTMQMGQYLVTYRGKKKVGININYEVEYFSLKSGKAKYEFTLFPHIQLNDRMGPANEPDTKHFFSKDIYTDVTFAEMQTKQEQEMVGGWTKTENNIMSVGKSIATSEYIISLDSLKTNMNEKEFQKADSLLIVTAVISITDMQKKVRKAYPQYYLRNRQVAPLEFIDEDAGLKFVFWKINPEEGTVEITLSEKVEKKVDFIVMEAIMFPLINILWIGCFIMIFGTALAVFQRIKKNIRTKIES